MKKIKLPNRPIGQLPTVLIGVEVNGKPNYVTIGVSGVVSLEQSDYKICKNNSNSIRDQRKIPVRTLKRTCRNFAL